MLSHPIQALELRTQLLLMSAKFGPNANDAAGSPGIVKLVARNAT